MLQGSIVALITPMTGDGQIDYTSLQNLVDYHVRSGTQAIVAVGTTGESSTLDTEEHISVVRHVVKYAAGRIPVIAGTGSNDTAYAIELTQALANSGVVAGLSVTPYYNKPSQEGLYQHFKTVAESSELPLILYNVPGRTGCDLLPQTVARLAEIPNIIGIKEATGSLERLQEIKACCPSDFLLYSGDDGSSCEFMLQGGHGTISVTANVAASQLNTMCQCALAGDREQALAADQPLRALHQALFIDSNPVPIKWACHAVGLVANGQLRLPLVSLAQDKVPELERALESAGVKVGE
ncbi:4-hydroxy-tetrahydrodipicolinate synthase [Dongshaea marina]|uniref:4-hydroxy-tetrahydrodipicolinate synthase n=1 Tax=Dongshaea marina TaxID=2047966 RepID=UPI000D3E488E|nr:4-hydroxy-tetrahydrodipicolinate synthase [Dongshaea marina]